MEKELVNPDSILSIDSHRLYKKYWYNRLNQSD